MKVHPKAERAQDDTVEYIFANLNCCMFHADEQRLMLEYSRGDYGAPASFTCSELDKIKPGLLDAITGFYNRFSNTVQFSRHAAAACAFVSDAYIDLSSVGLGNENYPFMAGIRYVRSTARQDVFVIDSRSFNVDASCEGEFPSITASDDEVSFIPAYALEKLLPGSTRDILTMESLGCSDREIVQNLFTRNRHSEMGVSLENVQFDLF